MPQKKGGRTNLPAAMSEAHGAFGHAAGGAKVEIAIGAVLVGVRALASIPNMPGTPSKLIINVIM